MPENENSISSEKRGEPLRNDTGHSPTQSSHLNEADSSQSGERDAERGEKSGIDSGETAPFGQPGSNRGRRRRRHPRGFKPNREAETASSIPKGPGRIMVFNAVFPDDMRVAILDNGQLDDLFIDRPRDTPSSGTIYKGRVTNVEPSLQAAFIDIGWEKNGFLHASDVIPPDGGYGDMLQKPPNHVRYDRNRKLKIEEMLVKGQEVLVQVTRESVALKGPGLTTYISIPGRYLVMMPAVPRLGVSRKIESNTERRDLRQKMLSLNPPKDVGVIVRTAGLNRGADDLKRDLDYLLRLWRSIQQKTRQSRPPSLIYHEADLVTRVIRDHFADDIEEIWCDSEAVAEQIRRFLDTVHPGASAKVRLHPHGVPIFHYFNIQSQVEGLNRRKVTLPGGGSIIIEQTEALVAIDVNTGGYREKDNMDETILEINRQAVPEIARQIRLRDLGGLIMIDFIDMVRLEHRQQVESDIRKALSEDKARINLLPISCLGVVEMTRQRTRQTLKKMLFKTCPCCEGMGMIKSHETLLFDILRETGAALAGGGVQDVRVALEGETALFVLNMGRRELAEMEAKYKVIMEIVGSKDILPGHFQIATRKKGENWSVYRTSEVEHVVRSG